MTDLSKTVQYIWKLMREKQTGCLSFKGKIEVGGQEVPFETEVHLFKGGIGNINFKQSIKLEGE